MKTKTVNAQGEHIEYDYGDTRYLDSSRKDQRKIGDKKRGWQVGEMWDRHHEIARRLVIGQSGADIAKDLSISEVQVSQVRNSPVVQDQMAILRACRDVESVDIATDILKMAPIALKLIKETLDTGKVHGQAASPSTILKEANSILDRNIGKPTQTIHTKNLHGHFTVDDLEVFKQKARELALESGQLAD